MENLTEADLKELLKNVHHQVMFDEISGSGKNGMLDLLVTILTPEGDVDVMVSISVDLTTAVKGEPS